MYSVNLYVIFFNTNNTIQKGVSVMKELELMKINQMIQAYEKKLQELQNKKTKLETEC